FTEKLHCNGIDLVYLTGKYQANANGISDMVLFVDDGTPLTNNRQVGYKDKKLIFGGTIAEFCLRENISWHGRINQLIAPELIVTKDFITVSDPNEALEMSSSRDFYSGFQRFEVEYR
ncbi:MAG: hypothetical protein AABY14_01430, partial [Nanoarchaeota archaeon]